MKGIAFKSTSGNDYFYDDSTGVIFLKDEENNLQTDQGIPVPFATERRHFDIDKEVAPDTIKDHLLKNAHGFRHLILEVATDCNMRCKYCVYSDYYAHNRSYAGPLMDFDTAKRAVDFYMKNFEKVNYRNPNSTPIVGFYGGEPLLNWKLIKKVVTYIGQEYLSKFDEILYTVTTNGLLFTEEVQDFLVENEFSIIVSLDGSKENHDRNRVNLAGKGSFDHIFRNIKKFKKNHPDYQRFGISACYDFKTDLFKLKEFFDETGLFLVNIALIDSHNSSYYFNFSEEDSIRFKESYEEFKKMFIEHARTGKVERNSFLYSYIGNYFANLAFHPMIRETRPHFLPYTGTCVPGEKLYINHSGEIHICEKINPNFPIGDLDGGLNYPRIANLIEEYNQNICKYCENCPVSRFCSGCYATFAKEDTFEKENGHCFNFQTSVQESLQSYVDVVEVKPDILDDLTVDYYQNILEKVGFIVE